MAKRQKEAHLEWSEQGQLGKEIERPKENVDKRNKASLKGEVLQGVEQEN